ncbi:MAG TPA: hypothetical protein VNY52_07775 [Solirubrobacteraceae bacterium]|jgi:hypothetical protein|nr:hypothetical protein [Solirubrobacteraceae bacterium]
MPSEQMLVVANSRKTGARCVAGVTLRNRRLVRPISPYGNGGLSDAECGVDGGTPQPLEIVSFMHKGSAGDPAQPENLVIAATPWKRDGTAAPDAALKVLIDVLHEGPVLFVNGGRAVPEHVATEGLEASLVLIEPKHLRFGHGPQAEAPYAGSPRALFGFGGQDWNLPVTDFDVGPKILRLPEGVYGWDELGLHKPRRTLLTMSLGTAHEGWHHKLVAAVLRFP